LYTGALTVNATLNVAANVTITARGTITENSTTINVKGNWANSGTYTGASLTSTVVFNGTATQYISGASVTYFKVLTINSGSTLMMSQNINVSETCTVNGTLDTNESPTYQLSGYADLTIGTVGTIVVNAGTVDQNVYTLGTVFLAGGSTVEYGSTLVNQVVYGFAYSTLKISGNTIKSLGGDVPTLVSSNTAYGNIIVTGGTLDLANFVAYRGTATTGGILSVATGATLRISGSHGLPDNYATQTFASGSTVEYYGSIQTIDIANYYNLVCTSGSRTLPASTIGIHRKKE
jgi:hypothetical protein